MLQLHMLEAEYGDCLILEYGAAASRRRILIDGGTPGTGASLRAAVEALPEACRHFELIVLTHIDADHIGGMLKLLGKPPAGFGYDDFWFNGFHHLASAELLGDDTPAGIPTPPHWDLLGVAQGESLSGLLWPDRDRWNRAFQGKAAVVPGGDEPLSPLPMKGGAKITLLSPTREKLEGLRKVWVDWLQEKGQEPYTGDEDLVAEGDRLGSAPDAQELAERPFQADKAPNNGSSIAFLFEWDGKAILLGADAHPDVLETSVRRICAQRGQDRLRIDALKVAHHGSKHNFDPRCLGSLACTQFLISTNGMKFGHPDDETLARIVTGVDNPTLYFNYPQDRSARWAKWKNDGDAFDMVFPDPEDAGLLVEF